MLAYSTKRDGCVGKLLYIVPVMYTIKLAQFEGPFDLLLFFIERDELDIYDIPITQLTTDFLAYIRQLEQMNIDVASEFILVAATLMRIKAAMLLPRKAKDENDQEIDPRQELVERLLEYKRFKGILDELQQLEAVRLNRQSRGNIQTEIQQLAQRALIDIELESLTLYKLMKTFQQVLNNYENNNRNIHHDVVDYPYTLESQRKYVLHQLTQYPKANFIQLFQACTHRVHAIVTFLAVLELIQQQIIIVTIGEAVNNFWLQPATPITTQN